MTYLFPFKIDIMKIFKFAETNFRGLGENIFPWIRKFMDPLDLVSTYTVPRYCQYVYSP